MIKVSLFYCLFNEVSGIVIRRSKVDYIILEGSIILVIVIVIEGVGLMIKRLFYINSIVIIVGERYTNFTFSKFIEPALVLNLTSW
jgi:TM2 domain-containing membrane protein YozV